MGVAVRSGLTISLRWARVTAGLTSLQSLAITLSSTESSMHHQNNKEHIKHNLQHLRLQSICCSCHVVPFHHESNGPPHHESCSMTDPRGGSPRSQRYFVGQPWARLCYNTPREDMVQEVPIGKAVLSCHGCEPRRRAFGGPRGFIAGLSGVSCQM